MDRVLCYTQSFSLWKCHKVVGKVLGYRKWLSSVSAGWGAGVKLQELCGEIKGSVRAWMKVPTKDRMESKGSSMGEGGCVSCRLPRVRVGSRAKVNAHTPKKASERKTLVPEL